MDTQSAPIRADMVKYLSQLIEHSATCQEVSCGQCNLLRRLCNAMAQTIFSEKHYDVPRVKRRVRAA